MKRKGFSILVVLVLVISLSLVAVVPVAGATTWTVDDDGGKDFISIATAVASASVLDGDTIEVYDGNYAKVVVSKELTIKAAAGNSPVVDGGGSGACFGIYKAAGLDGVTIEGFEIRNAAYGIWIYGAGALSTTYDNIILSNNNIHDHVWNGILVTHAAVNSLTISGNTVDNSGIGISFANNSIVDGLTVAGNTITNNDAGLSLIQGTFSDIAVSNCYFEGNAWEHVDLGCWGNWPSLSDVSITECQFLSGPWCGVYVQSTFNPGDIQINYNNFLVGSWGLWNLATTVVGAERNWWGHSSGPSGPGGRVNGAGKVIGQGDAIYGLADWDPCLPQPINHTKHDPVPPGLS